MELEQSKSHTGYLAQSTDETFLQSIVQYDDIQLNVDEGIMNNLFDTAWRSSNAENRPTYYGRFLELHPICQKICGRRHIN
jgi:hypothetical protein